MNYKDYQIVKAGSSEELTITVKQLLKENWKPIGPVKITKEESHKLFTFYQTMVLLYVYEGNYKIG